MTMRLTKQTRAVMLATHEKIVSDLIEHGCVETQRVREVRNTTLLDVPTAAGLLSLTVEDDALYGRFASDVAYLLDLIGYNPHSRKYNMQDRDAEARVTPDWFHHLAMGHVLNAMHAELRDREVQ